MWDLETIRKMNNEKTPPEELGKAQTYAEIQEAAKQEEEEDWSANDRNEH